MTRPKFVTSAHANHWGRSDLRAYLNNMEKNDNTLLTDSAVGGTNNGNFPSKFSDAEYDLVQPFKYSTNVLDSSQNATAVYETTDKFWLPSGKKDNRIISWGSDDISSNSQYSRITENGKQYIIPRSYWSCGDAWLRSAYGNYWCVGYVNPSNGSVVYNSTIYSHADAPAFKIDLSSVIFASAASAASIANDGGAETIEIAGSANFGNDPSSLPNYGMYLKIKNTNDSFSPTSLSLAGMNLTVNYTGGVANQYVVVHAFKEDSLNDGHTSYVATQKLTTSASSATIDVSNWDIASLDGYTIKVWMEDDSGSLAKATTPVTFVGTTQTESGASTNARVFAMKEDLQTSWGDLSALSEEDYNKVISGNSTSENSGVMGQNPTNQKIYFGGMEFWIAGRETAANGGEIDHDGEIMTLYQAKSVETRKFNASTSDYSVSGKFAVTLQLVDNQSGAIYPEESITFTQNSEDLEKNLLKWQHRTPGTTAWTEDMPTDPGSYEIRCYAEGTENYERTYSANVNFEAMGTPSASDFSFTAPSNLTYDGIEKTANVTSTKSDMGDITVKYYDSSERQLGSAPTNAGTYTVKIDVAVGDSYVAANDLTDESWKFTIAKKSITPQITAENKEYDGTTNATINKVEFEELQNEETLTEDDYNVDSVAFDNANAGDGKTVTATISLKNSAKANNYTLSSDSATATANITRKPITPVITANSKAYDGTTDAEVEATFTGMIAGETLVNGEDYTVSAAFDDKNIGNNKTVTATISLKTTDKTKNYTLTSNSATATANIALNAITAKITVDNKEYDGTTNATISKVEFEGLQNGETLTEDDYNVDSVAFDNANAGDGKTVTANISLKDSAKANNYTLTSNSATATANISKKSITPVITANSKAYDGTTDAEVGVEFTGVIAGETLVNGEDYTVSAAFDNANAGDGKTVTANISLKTTDKTKNYTLTSNSVTATANIALKAITAKITVDNKEYDGTTNATINKVEFEGLQNGETLTEDDYNVDSVAFDNANAGDGKTVTATISLKDNAKANNYTLSSDSATATANITKKSITVTADSKSKVEGNTDAELTYTIAPETPLVGTETLNGILSRDAGEAVGTYNITQGTLTNENNPNYDIAFVPAEFTITAKPAPEPPKDEHTDWGKPEDHEGITHYVDDKGMTSVEISQKNTDANGIVWLREESDDTSAWYGLENSSGTFENGSRFWVRWLNKNSDKEDWDKYYAMLDDTHKANIDGEELWIFLVGVTAPDGTEYTNLDKGLPFYVQLGDDWSINEINAAFISSGEDEIIEASFEENTAYPEGNNKFAKLTLNHFSPYAVYDKKSADLNNNDKDSNTSAGSSGNNLSNSNTNLSDVFSTIDFTDFEDFTDDLEDLIDDFEEDELTDYVSTGENSMYLIVFSILMLFSSLVILKTKKKRKV